MERRSKLHLEVLNVLQSIFHPSTIKEEYALKVDNKILYLDLYIPNMKLAFEINGQQHYKFVKHMHGQRSNFTKQKLNDQSKAYWCNQQGITLITIRFDDVVTREFILNKIKGEDHGS